MVTRRVIAQYDGEHFSADVTQSDGLGCVFYVTVIDDAGKTVARKTFRQRQTTHVASASIRARSWAQQQSRRTR